MSFSLMAQTPFGDLTNQGTSTADDSLIIRRNGTPYKMAKPVFQKNVIDSLTIHLSMIQDLDDSVNIIWEAVFVDTIGVREDLFNWPTSDSSQLVVDKKLGGFFYPGPDSMHVDTARVVCPTGSPNFTYNIHWAYDISGADVDMFSSAVQVEGAEAIATGEVDVPNNADIPPRVWIWFTIDAATVKPPNGAWISTEGTYF